MPVKMKRKSKVANRQTQVSSEILPRRTLEQAIRVVEVIRNIYAGKATTWPEVAQGLGVSTHPQNRYLLWSAIAYGLVIRDDKSYSLAETGRKILAPTYDGEREEGIKKALFTPSVLSRFYTDYNESPLPNDEHFPNVLETRYGIPRGEDQGSHRNHQGECSIRRSNRLDRRERAVAFWRQRVSSSHHRDFFDRVNS